MKRRCGIVKAVGLAFAFALLTIPAHATVEVTITDGNGAHNFLGAPCGPETCVSADVPGSLDFALEFQGAQSTAPSGPASLTMEAALIPLKAELLTIEVSDIDFAAPAGGGVLTEAAFTEGSGTGNFGTFSATGYYGTGANDVFFCQRTACDASTPTAKFGSFSSLNPVQRLDAPVSFATPFSLDEVMKYNFTGPGIALTVVTLSAVVPEPASVILFGGALLIMAGGIRRKLAHPKDA